MHTRCHAGRLYGLVILRPFLLHKQLAPPALHGAEEKRLPAHPWPSMLPGWGPRTPAGAFPHTKLKTWGPHMEGEQGQANMRPEGLGLSPPPLQVSDGAEHKIRE